MKTELSEFIHSALVLGIKRPDIAYALKQAGWSDADIKNGLNSYIISDFTLPVPRPKPYVSARDVFLYLVMFSALYCLCWHAGSILFDVINLHYPDAAREGNYWRGNYQDSIRWSVSALVVSLPVFFFTFRSIQTDINDDSTRRHSRPRKWLTYITLFIATIALMGDAGTLVYALLSGELTTVFILKVLVVCVIAGGNFIYFLQDMRRE